MNRLSKRLLLIICACATLTSMAARRTTILSVKDTIVDNDIVYPESFETDTHELMKNWYLQNYTVLDADVEKRDAGTVSDEEYIKRLQAMPTSIEMPYNQVVRSYIDRYIKRHRTLVEEMLGMSLYYMPIFEQALEKEGMPLELKYLPVIESALNPTAVSRAGAAGLWQFMVGTGKGLGLEVNSLVDERRDPYKSSEKAAIYLKNLYNIYNDWSLAIAAYNCGPGNVNKALRRAGGENKDFWEIYPYLPKETRGYVPAFIAANYVMTYFKRHNISPSLAKKPLITDTVGVNNRVHFNQISKVLNIPLEELRALNPQFRTDVIPGNSERTYQLILPTTQVASYIMSEDSIKAYRSDLYAQRGLVEPAGYQSDDRPFTYETKTITSHHKVRKGESLGRIASQYGMSKSQLMALNGIKGSRVQRGQVLKVQTTKKVKVYQERPQSDTNSEANNDDIKVVHNEETDQPTAEEIENAQIEEVKRIEQEAKNTPKKSRRVAVEETPKVEKKAAKIEKTEDSAQWRNRNERYANKDKQESREDTYRKSRSSKSEEVKQQERERKTSEKKSTESKSDKKAAETKAEQKQDKKTAADKKQDKKAATEKKQDKKGKDKKNADKKADEKPKKGSEYTIKKGESLSVIAEKAGVSVEELQKANKMKGDKIKAGDAITIPGKASKGSKKGNDKKDKKGGSKDSKSSSKKKKK